MVEGLNHGLSGGPVTGSGVDANALLMSFFNLSVLELSSEANSSISASSSSSLA